VTALPNQSGRGPGWKEEDFAIRQIVVLERVERGAQLDGFACAYCGGRGGPMRPISDGPQGQLFMHADPCFLP
jgi:hypothetical protein